jgi:hypothetical protein
MERLSSCSLCILSVYNGIGQTIRGLDLLQHSGIVNYVTGDVIRLQHDLLHGFNCIESRHKGHLNFISWMELPIANLSCSVHKFLLDLLNIT